MRPTNSIKTHRKECSGIGSGTNFTNGWNGYAWKGTVKGERMKADVKYEAFREEQEKIAKANGLSLEEYLLRKAYLQRQADELRIEAKKRLR